MVEWEALLRVFFMRKKIVGIFFPRKYH